MGKSRPVSLQTFIYRTLTARLVAKATIIGLVAVVIVYVVEDRNLRARVVDGTRTEIQLLVLRTVQFIRDGKGDRNAAFSQALDERLAVNLNRENGAFVYAGFHDMETQTIEERRDSEYVLNNEVLEFIRLHPLTGTEAGERAENVRIGGTMHIHVVLPIEYHSEKVGVVRGVFAPSEAVLADMKKRLRRSVTQSIMIVLVTRALLYPVIMLLVGKLAVFSRDLLDANLEALSLLARIFAYP